MKTIILSANTSRYLFNFRKSTIQHFIKIGCRVICVSKKDDCSEELLKLGANWIHLEISNKGSNPFKDIKVVFRLFYIYIKHKPDVIYHFTIKNNIYGTWAAFFSNIPCINNITGLGTAFIHKSFISYIVKVLYKLSQPLAHRVYCQNSNDFELILNQKLVPHKKLFLLPGSGIDINRFHPDLIKEKPKTFTFLFAGRLLADKGIFELMESMKDINKNKIICNLWVCGFLNSDNLSAISPKNIREWKNLQYIKWIEPTNQIESVMKHVSCIVLPSYREGMARTLLEAGAMGIPCVTTDVPGCKDVIKDGENGFLCNARDSNSLKLAMMKMINSSEEHISSMAKIARKNIEENFNESIVINAAVEGLNSI